MKNPVLLFLLTVLPFADSLGQSTSLVDFIRCVEQQYGPDNLLINGRPYFPGHLRADGHPYFQTKEWKPGRVYIRGNSYPAKYLKYNLLNQQLIIKRERPNGTLQEVVLSDLLVDSFQIKDHRFVNQRLILPEKENEGYLEKIFEEEQSFYRLQKKVVTSPSGSSPYGRFSDLKEVYYLLSGDQLHTITRKKEFLACFPEHKSQIKKYIKRQSLKWKKMTNMQFTHLLKFCYDQI